MSATVVASSSHLSYIQQVFSSAGKNNSFGPKRFARAEIKHVVIVHERSNRITFFRREIGQYTTGVFIKCRECDLWFLPENTGACRDFGRKGIAVYCQVTFRSDISATYFEPVFSGRNEEHTSELQSQFHLVCRLLLEKT